ncbi:deoxyribodipyrimidine photo-lyase [Nostoc sp. NMS8]|uniref:deoxyribodipyrimidine photo-lyase n=1 Tax=Nostoc sp. NMS8 TaxID=2815392 RepID=UPI0025F324F7|nr:deoxyribodipyrimidine photo-lyase [Nostoc sp. NMS8]
MHLLWFRRDLRLTDNEIVTLATANDAAVKPLFIVDPWFYQWVDVGKARVRFLFESLENLDSNLRKLGSRLYLFEGNSTDIVQELTKQLIEQGYSPKLFFNRDVQVEYGISRDKTIVDFYKQLNLDYHIGLNNFLQSAEQRDEWFNQYYENSKILITANTQYPENLVSDNRKLVNSKFLGESKNLFGN